MEKNKRLKELKRIDKVLTRKWKNEKDSYIKKVYSELLNVIDEYKYKSYGIITLRPFRYITLNEDDILSPEDRGIMEEKEKTFKGG